MSLTETLLIKHKTITERIENYQEAAGTESYKVIKERSILIREFVPFFFLRCKTSPLRPIVRIKYSFWIPNLQLYTFYAC